MNDLLITEFTEATNAGMTLMARVGTCFHHAYCLLSEHVGLHIYSFRF